VKDRTSIPFLARPGYQRRRLIEVIRLVPFLGLFMFLFPILWAGNTGEDPSRTSNGWIYLFVIWFLLIAVAFILARLHDLHVDEKDSDPK